MYIRMSYMSYELTEVGFKLFPELNQLYTLSIIWENRAKHEQTSNIKIGNVISEQDSHNAMIWRLYEYHNVG